MYYNSSLRVSFKAQNPNELPRYDTNALQTLIKTLICGSEQNKSEKSSRLTFSISQYICMAATKHGST